MRSDLLVSAIWITLSMSMGIVRVYGENWSLVSAITQDDTWTVIEYPEGQEVLVQLMPTAFMPDAKGTARVKRNGNETQVHLDAQGLKGDEINYEIYIVDMLGNASVLGTLTTSDGAGAFNATIALTKFMIVVSPETDLNTIDPETKVALRSAVPPGFTVVPKEQNDEPDHVRTKASNSQLEAVETEISDYDIPLLGINSLRRGASTTMRANFSSGFEGTRASIDIKPQKNGPTKIQMRISNLKDAPAGTQYVIWQVTPAKSFSLLGNLTSTGRKNETKIDAESALADFGLFITLESSDTTPSSPTGKLVAMIFR